MRSLPWSARLYILFLAALMTGAVLISLETLDGAAPLWLSVAVIALGIAVLDGVPIDLYREEVEITLSNAVKFAAVLLCPAPVVIVGTFAGTLLGEIPSRRSSWVKKLFNVSEMTVTYTVVAWVYTLLREPNVNYFGSAQNVASILVSGLTDFTFNSFLVALVITLAGGLSFRYVWTRNYRQIVVHELSIIPLGLFLAVLWLYNPLSVVLAGLPLFVVRHSFRIAIDLQSQTGDALRALVRVIDERDHHTFDHSEQVSNHARLIAEELDISAEEVDVIALAGLVHDLGKVGMADDILFNPRSLNSEERMRAQRHAEVGSMLLSKFPLFDKGAVLVRHHHERYDGAGYPDGLAGQAIPIGSRIISVADSYQAMTEERPYRHALSRDDAVAALIAGSGSQFDPVVVDAFLRVLKSEPYVVASLPTVAPQLSEVG
ncbi:MAG: HD-GYP domain-containing protein [Chloroflexi bacterium]|nr:HD-GYP domain-containing protein [Chloroflexota bacterium]